MIATRGRGALVFVNVAAVAAVLAGPGLPDGPSPEPAPTAPLVRTASAAPTGPVAEVVDITNAERAKAGCPALQVDARLATAAQLHSEDMSANNYFSHTSQDGRTFVDRVRAQGYPSPGAENIAKGQRSAAAVMTAWMGSDGHRRNILNCSLRAIGVGLAPGNVWTQVFGFTAPAAAPPTAPPAPPTPAPPAPTTTAPVMRAEEVVHLTNVERAKAGCPALLADSRLARAARLHSQDMAANNYFSHTSRDGRSFADRIRAQGFSAPAAENIARGQRTPAAVMQAWMNSAGHRRNILNCSLRVIGAGVATGDSGLVWTQDFGR